METEYDLIVIGGGPGGYHAAMKAASLGLKTAMIERGRAGGTCLNRGCVPTKALLHGARLYSQALNAAQFGVKAEALSYDDAAAAAYRDETVDTLVGGLISSIEKSGVRILHGSGKVTAGTDGSGRRMVRFTPAAEDGSAGAPEQMLSAADVIAACGSAPLMLPIEGAGCRSVITSDDILTGPELPKSLVIIGGGVIGCEFAALYTDLGRPVTVIEALPRILGNMDIEISRSLSMILKKRGAQIITAASVTRISEDAGGSAAAEYECKGKKASAKAEKILMAAGRRALTADAFEDGLDIAVERGRIVVDKYYETSEKHIYAVGDIVPGIQLAHNAGAQGTAAACRIAGAEADIRTSVDFDNNGSLMHIDTVPACVYTSPEIASIGLTQAQAREAGIDAVCAKAVTGSNARSVISREDRGFVRLVAEAHSGRLLGAQMMCADAVDIIGELSAALANAMTAEQLRRAVRAHPTYEEILSDALEQLP